MIKCKFKATFYNPAAEEEKEYVLTIMKEQDLEEKELFSDAIDKAYEQIAEVEDSFEWMLSKIEWLEVTT